jgi:hypothetical protein
MKKNPLLFITAVILSIILDIYDPFQYGGSEIPHFYRNQRFITKATKDFN